MSEELKIYSAAELARYHRGEMTAAEMHAIEKAALDDPFLADALEGYAYTTTPEADLKDLQERLASKKTEAKIIPLQPKKNTWWKVAAAAAVLGGGTYLFNSVNKKAEQAPLAKTENKIQPAPQTQTVTNAPSPDTAPAGFTQGAETKPTSPITFAQIHPGEKTGYFHTLPADKASRLQENAADSLKQGAESYDYRAMRNETAGVKEREKTEDAKLIEQNKEKFAAKTQTASAAEMITSTNLETVEIKDKNAAGYKRAQGKVTATRLNPDSTTDFDRYVTMNNRLPAPKENNNSYRGTVVLSFKVNKKGKPVKIRTENTVCGECDKEAIRLLKEGPAWEYKPDNARRTVSIPF